MELLDKVKKALIDSGFPLEMKTGKILKEMGWDISFGARYVDFETQVLRELDITANKDINGVQIHLFIECKKSDSKQLVLYAPSHNRSYWFFSNPLRYFPRPGTDKRGQKRREKLTALWSDLPIFDDTVPVSNSIIFTRGEKIEQNNDTFFGALNGIIKKSIDTDSDGYIETGFRMMFFYLLIYDGVIYQMMDGEDKEFELVPAAYGQYKFEYRFKLPTVKKHTNYEADLEQTSRLFNFHNIIEIMQPDHLKTYLEHIEQTLTGIKKQQYKGWGQSMSDFDPGTIEDTVKSKSKKS